MEAIKHPAYKREKEHLEEVKEWVAKEKVSMEEYEENLKGEIRAIRKTHFSFIVFSMKDQFTYILFRQFIEKGNS